MPELSQDASHTEYQIERARTRNDGIVASPIAGKAPQNVSLVRLHAPIEFETIYWSASRKGAPPIVPSPECLNNNKNRLFLYGQQSALVGVPVGDGHTYCIAGAYYFVIVGPEGLSSNFRLGKMPWEDSPELQNYIPSTNFLDTGIIDDTYVQPAGLPMDPAVPMLQDPLGT